MEVRYGRRRYHLLSANNVQPSGSRQYPHDQPSLLSFFSLLCFFSIPFFESLSIPLRYQPIVTLALPCYIYIVSATSRYATDLSLAKERLLASIYPYSPRNSTNIATMKTSLTSSSLLALTLLSLFNLISAQDGFNATEYGMNQAKYLGKTYKASADGLPDKTQTGQTGTNNCGTKSSEDSMCQNLVS